MSSSDATEFEGRVEVNATGQWGWKIVAVNGHWPSWLSGSGSIKTRGTTWSRWGSKVEARRALKRIRRVVERKPAEMVK